jgi:hypothetical protein
MKKFIPTVTRPPDFYEKDMKNWENRLKKAIEDRQILKEILDKKLNGPNPNYGLTEEQKKKKTVGKKRPTSRYSKNTFDKVDFNYVGNTEHVSYIFLEYLLIDKLINS